METKNTNHLHGINKLIVIVLGCIVKVWGRTLRMSFAPDHRKMASNSEKPTVCILWHNRLFVAAEFQRRFRRKRKTYGLVSASKDGAWLADFLEQLGQSSVRGSQNHRGKEALREMVNVIKDGNDLAITPDGSKGPCYTFKPGALLVAKITKSPVLLVSFEYSNAWQLKSWDKFYIPYPFSKITIHCDRLEQLPDGSAKDLVPEIKERLDDITTE